MMELKDLFSKFASEEEKKEQFLALNISSKTVWAAVWQPEEEVKIVSLGTKEKWDGKTLESLTTAADNSLAAALESLPEEPNKVIFGLPETWVSKDKIVSPRLSDLKALCEKLDLTPLGFVLTTKAIIQYLKILEGVPLSAILIGVKKEEISLTLVHLGKILGTQAVGRSGDFAADVYEGLARFDKKEPFPSRILLYNDANLETERQALLAYNWPKSLFLHFPKIEILEREIAIKAVVIAGGREVVASLGLEKKVSADELGFFKDKDVAQKKKEEKKPFLAKFRLPRINLPKLKVKLPHLRLPQLKLRPSLPLALLIGLLIFFVLGGIAIAAYWYLPKAQVVIFLKADNLEKEIEVKVDPELTTPDREKKQIPGEIIETKLKDSLEKETTGEKLVGDKARGEVTVYNFTDNSKSFNKGTVITSPDQKKFSLEVDITVASASSSFDESWRQVITPGTTKVTVVALEIGPDYNLPSGTEFNIANYSPSSYRAKNEKAFSGGTSRKVQVVSTKDREELLNQLTARLEEKVKEELKKNIPQGKKILETAILTSIINRNFDKAVGTEADKLRLELEMKAKTLAYSASDLDSLVDEALADYIPQNFILKGKEVEIKEEKINEEGVAILKVYVKGNLIPDVDIEAIKKNLAGKYPSVANDYLQSLPSFTKVEMNISPKLPARLKTLPRLSKNISVKIEVRE